MYTIDFYSTILSSSNTIDILYKKCNKLEDKINNTNYFINNIKRYGLNKQLANSLKIFHNESNLNRLLDSIELTNTKNIATSKEVISILNNNLNIYKDNLSSLKESIYSTSKVLASVLSDTNSEVSSSLLYELSFNKDINTIIEIKNKLINKFSCDISYDSIVHISNKEYREDQTEVANEGFKEVVSFIWEKIKKAFKWIVEKLSKLYNVIKSFIKKLFSKFTKKENTNTKVEKTGLEKLIELFSTKKYEILRHTSLVALVHMEENLINIIKNKFNNNEKDFLENNTNLLKSLFESGDLKKDGLSESIINYLSSSTNKFDNNITFKDLLNWQDELFSKMPKLEQLTTDNTIEAYNRYYEVFQKYADILTNTTEHIVNIIRKISNAENPFIFLADKDFLKPKKVFDISNDYFTILGTNIANAYIRIDSLIQTNNIQYMKMFRDVLASFEQVMGVKDNKRVEQRDIEIIQKALENSNPEGTIDGFKWFIIEKLGSDIRHVLKSVRELNSAFGGIFDDATTKRIKMTNALCCYIPGLNKPIIITSQYMVDNLSADELKFILYHECGHARNGHQIDFLKLLHRYEVSGDDIPWSILSLKMQGGRNLHDELEADAYGIEHTSPDTCITALNKLLELMSDSKFFRFIQKYLSDINTRIKYAKKWKKTGQQPPLPKRDW